MPTDPARARRADGRHERARSTRSTTSGWSTSGCCSSTAPTRTRSPRRARRPARLRRLPRSSFWPRTGPMSTARAVRPGAATCRCERRTSTPSCAGRTSSRSCSHSSAPRPSVDPADARRRLDRARRAADGAAPRDARPRRAGSARPLGAARTARARARRRRAVTSAASSAARRKERCSTTPPGSARCENVERLLAARRRPGRRVRHFDTPLAWAAHGSQDFGASGRDHVGVAERLVAAGAQIEPRFLELADGPLAEWLQTMSIASPNE